MIKTKTLKKEERREEPLRWAALGGLEEVGRNMTFLNTAMK